MAKKDKGAEKTASKNEKKSADVQVTVNETDSAGQAIETGVTDGPTVDDTPTEAIPAIDPIVKPGDVVIFHATAEEKYDSEVLEVYNDQSVKLKFSSGEGGHVQEDHVQHSESGEANTYSLK